MTSLLFAPLALAQAGLPPTTEAAVPAEPVPTIVQSRLTRCLGEAQIDPAAAIRTASQWLDEVSGPAEASARQCMGFAHISELRWDAAESAFLAARSALPESEVAGRARLAAMAGNAALAADSHSFALRDFELAQADAAASGDPLLSGDVATDRARALVGLGRFDEAEQALADARRDAPRNAATWLLSATLARRLDVLDKARGFVEAAAALAPEDPAVALESGLIAALSGQDDLARQNWHAVIANSPQSPEAKAAFYYLMQIDPTQEPQ